MFFRLIVNTNHQSLQNMSGNKGLNMVQAQQDFDSKKKKIPRKQNILPPMIFECWPLQNYNMDLG